MRRLLSLGVLLILVIGVMVGATGAGANQGDATPTLQDLCAQLPDVCQDPDPVIWLEAPAEEEEAKGESVFGEGAAADLLAIGVIPAAPPHPAAMALQRVRIAPGGRIVTPGDDPRVVLVYIESGTLTVRNTVDSIVTRGAALATPGAQAYEAIPAETEFTMTAGDSSLSPAGSGGEWRNDGTEEVVVLASLIIPIEASEATPESGTPVR